SQRLARPRVRRQVNNPAEQLNDGPLQPFEPLAAARHLSREGPVVHARMPLFEYRLRHHERAADLLGIARRESIPPPCARPCGRDLVDGGAEARMQGQAVDYLRMCLARDAGDWSPTEVPIERVGRLQPHVGDLIATVAPTVRKPNSPGILRKAELLDE